MSITHAKVSAKADSGDTTLIRPSDWNAAHVGNGLGWYNVKEYGAVGNDSADDTTPIANAIAAAFASGGVVYFPAGTYITSPIKVPPAVTLQGATGQGYYNATSTVPNLNTISRLRLKSGSTDSLIEPDDGGTNLATHVRIADLALDGNGLAQMIINIPDSGVSISRFWRFERVYVVNSGQSSGSAVYIGNQNTACLMSECVLFNGTSGSPAGNNALTWYGSDGVMRDCWIGYWGGTGLDCTGGSNDEYLSVVGGGIFTCTTGVVVSGRGAVFVGVSIDHNFNDGVYAAYPCTFIGCWFHTNSRTTNNQWSDITIAGAVPVTIIGCRFTPHSGETSNVVKYHIAAPTAILNQLGNVEQEAAGTGFTSFVGTYSAPAFPASTVALQNNIGADVQAFITNGAAEITVVKLGATTTGLTIAANAKAVIRIPQGQSVTFTYASGTPTWTWVIG